MICGGTAINAGAQNFFYEWGYGLGAGGNETGKSIATDSDGNVIIVNEFTATYDADPNAGTSNLTLAGSTDVAISKFDSNGNLIWAKSIGGAAGDIVSAVSTDDAGNIYISGGFSSTVDFDPGAGVQNKLSAGGLDIYLLKLDVNGDFQWVYTNGTAQNEEAREVAIDHNDNVYLLGYFRLTLDFDIGVGTTNLTVAGGADVFVLKLSNAGNFTSVYQAGGTLDDDPNGLAIDGANNVYVSGYFQGTTDFDSGAGTQNLTSAGSNDIFVLKINAAGTFSWVKQFGSTGADLSWALEVDKNNDVVVGGYYSGIVDFDPGVGTDSKTSVGGKDLLLVKLDDAGNYIWGVSAGSIADDEIWDICFDQDNNIFATGFFRYTVDFDPSGATQNVTVTGGASFADQFYWKLDQGGNFLFAEHVGSTNNDHGFDVHTDGQFLYTSGYFIGTADFDLTAATTNVTAAGGSDASFAKHINCNPIHTNDVIVSCGDYTWIDGITYTLNNNSATQILTNMYGCDSTVHLNLTIKTINDQTVTPSISTLCDNGNVTVDVASSQSGVFYSLVDQSTMTVIDGPTEGNGSALTFNAGNITTTTTYEVQAEGNRYNSLTFTGNSPTPTHVDLGNTMNDVFKGQNNITAEAWVNTTSTSSLQSVVGNYQDLGNTMQFLLRLDQSAGTNKATFWVGTGTTPGSYQVVVGTTTILPNTWYHLAGTFDGTTISIYVNGVLENQATITPVNLPESSNNIKIGGGLSNNTEYFYGDITGVRIWNTARTQTEINDNKDLCIAGNEPGLVAMYNMIDGPGSSTLTDESVNGFNGTLLNMDPATSWQYTNMPSMTCSMCYLTMTQTPTVTVNYSNTGSDVQEQCESYIWIDGNTYTTSNSTATFTLTNISGCDSVVTLNLTINMPDATTDVQVACDSYLWIDGNTYTTDNTTAFVTLANMNGCDSVVTLNLNIETSPAASAINNGDGTMTATGTGTYQWIDCGTNSAVSGATSATFVPTANGDYSVVVTNGSCDDTSACVNYNSVGLVENGNSVFTAYPNPTNGLITVSSNNAIITLIVVRDAAGRVIYEIQNFSSKSTVDLTEMENGIYFITIFDADNVPATMKVMKQ